MTSYNIRGPDTSSFFICMEKIPEQNSIYLVSGHAILFHLFKFAFELILAFSFLLRTANIDLPAIQFFSIHVIYSLQ